jgi:putative cofactor-binding repeat protein
VVQGCTLDKAGGFDEAIAITGSIEVAVAQSSTSPGLYYWLEPDYSPAGDVILDVSVTGNTIRNAPRAALFVANTGGTPGILVNNNTFDTCGSTNTLRPDAEEYAVALQTCGAGGGTGNTWINCAHNGVSYIQNSGNIDIQ